MLERWKARTGEDGLSSSGRGFAPSRFIWRLRSAPAPLLSGHEEFNDGLCLKDKDLRVKKDVSDLRLDRLFRGACSREKLFFSQVVELIHPQQFRRCVACYRGNYKVKAFSCWDQFLCMAFAELILSREPTRHLTKNRVPSER